MNKPVSAIEISSENIKLVVGYVLDDKVHILYDLNVKMNSLNENGEFSDPDKVIDVLQSLKKIVDPSLKLKFDVENVILCVPSFGLEVFQTKQTTTVIGEDGKINSLDIKNLFSLIKNSHLPSSNTLVDIVPDYFVTDDRAKYSKAPYGKKSSTLMVSAKVLSLPQKIIDQYKTIMKQAGISVERICVGSFAAGALISSYPSIPRDYLLVDFGSHVTNVTLIGNGLTFGSRFFPWGGSNITERIIENFNINEGDAERCKILYGIDKTIIDFKAPVSMFENASKEKIPHYQDELNAVIENELEKMVRELNIAIDQLLEGYDESYKNMPIVLIGGTSLLNGLVDFISPKLRSKEIIPLIPSSLGARNPSLFNCLGMIYVNDKYANPQGDKSSLRVGSVSRKND